MIEIVAATGSTNSDLVARIKAGEQVAEGAWLVADLQTAGRGRLGREWCDGAGNFMGSTTAFLAGGDPPAATLALMAGLAVHAAVAGLLPAGISALLKWPNDVLVAGRKLAGILLERVGDQVVIGIGVNLAQAPTLETRETVALASFGPAPDRDRFAETLARCLAQELQRWRGAGLAPLLRRWQAAAYPIGTPLSVQDPGGQALAGTFAGLAADGGLRLALAGGTIRIIHAGDVLLAAED